VVDGSVLVLDGGGVSGNSVIGGGCVVLGCGGTGGSGLGGGLFGSSSSTLTLGASAVVFNAALGGHGGSAAAGGRGEGIGGGIYDLGTLTLAAATRIANNFASTSGPNVAP